MVELHFEQLPALWPCYLRALVSGRTVSQIANVEIPGIRATTGDLVADARHLRRFRELLTHPDDGLLPPTFPQVLAAPLHLAVLTAKDFPLRATGLVHLSNTIHYVEAIPQDQRLTLSASISSGLTTARGIEITLETTASVNGRCYWQASSLLLARRSGERQRQRRRTVSSEIEMREIDHWRADGNIGRRYASVSGDYNPIHLHRLTARAFGFRSAIAHGMWSLGRSVVGLHNYLQPPYELYAEFRRPMLLPAEVRLLLAHHDPLTFNLVDAASNKAYLVGSIALQRD